MRTVMSKHICNSLETNAKHTWIPCSMNPLGLDVSRFLVASTAQGSLLACGQLEPKPSAAKLEFQELRTLIVAKNARSGSCSDKR